MKRDSFTHTAVAMLVIGCMTCGTALAETDLMGGKAIVRGEVNAGFQQTIVDGESAKFEEYRDVEQGIVLHDLRLKVDGAATPYYLDIRVKDLVQEDEFYGVKGGIHGKYNFGLYYDAIPHNFSHGRLLLNDLGGGRFAIGDAVQQQLQANEVLRSSRLTYDPVTGIPLGIPSLAGGAFINPADAQNMALDAGMTGIVNNLYATANSIKFGLKREKTGFNFDFVPYQDVKVWTKVSNEKRTGNRRINQGTYERYNNGVTSAGDPLGHIVDYFLVAGVELPETIDYRTTAFNVGTGIYKKHWLADLEYTFTNFENEVHSLVWDNPFRLDSAPATAAGGGVGNPFNRGRSALGQLTLTPDSHSHEFTVSGSAELPHHSRFTGTLSYGWVIQDDAFDPYTLNSAIIADNVAGAPAAAGLALPQGDLDGKVATLFQSYQLTSKPIEPLAVTLRYRYYDYDNKSDNILFPGYSAFGDSFWRTAKNDVPGPDAPVRNEALSYTRQNAELAFDYQVMKPLTLTLEGFWENWDREQLRIDETNEFGVGAGFLYKPIRNAKLKGAYRYAHRTVDGYVPGATAENPEAIGLQNYDWADRVRQKVDLKLQIMPMAAVNVGVSGQYHNDEFGDDNRFGLKENDAITGAIDVGYAFSDALSIYASYAKDFRKGYMQAGAKDDPFNAPATPIDDPFATDNFNPLNYWNSDIYEKVDSVGLGVTFQVIPTKLTLHTSYNVSYSKIDINTYNPNGVKLLNAAAQDFPTVKNYFQEVKTEIAYIFTKNLKSGVTYAYEVFNQHDYANTAAYMAGATFENSTKYLFTGANNLSYDAHIVGAYVNYKF